MKSHHRRFNTLRSDTQGLGREPEDPCNCHASEILDAVGDAFLTLDKESRVTYANKELGRLLNRDVSKLIGLPHG